MTADLVRPTSNTEIYADRFVDAYRSYVHSRHGATHVWPVLSGWNLDHGCTPNFVALIFRHRTGQYVHSFTEIHPMLRELFAAETLDAENRESIRSRVRERFGCQPMDSVVLLAISQPLEAEVLREAATLYEQHEPAMNPRPRKIFLSHKGADKPLVRRFAEMLRLLGFEPWLDEDAMTAGTKLERGILNGIKESCAVVFFMTPSFKDERYLATEIEYGIQEERERAFSIVAVVFETGPTKVVVPDLLRRYVFKEVDGELQAMQEILRALPVQVGPVRWRVGS